MAQVRVAFPALLRPFVDKAGQVSVQADTVHHALISLCKRYPALENLLFDENGALREHVLCYHNEENTRWYDQGLHKPLQTGDQLTIIQAVAGG